MHAMVLSRIQPVYIPWQTMTLKNLNIGCEVDKELSPKKDWVEKNSQSQPQMDGQSFADDDNDDHELSSIIYI